MSFSLSFSLVSPPLIGQEHGRAAAGVRGPHKLAPARPPGQPHQDPDALQEQRGEGQLRRQVGELANY